MQDEIPDGLRKAYILAKFAPWILVIWGVMFVGLELASIQAKAWGQALFLVVPFGVMFGVFWSIHSVRAPWVLRAIWMIHNLRPEPMLLKQEFTRLTWGGHAVRLFPPGADPAKDPGEALVIVSLNRMNLVRMFRQSPAEVEVYRDPKPSPLVVVALNNNLAAFGFPKKRDMYRVRDYLSD